MIIGIILQIESYLCHFILLHILTHENSGNDYSHSFDEDHSYKTFLDFHFVFGVSNIMVCFSLSVAEGIVRKLAKCRYPHKRRHQIHCLTWAFFISLA